MGPMEVATASPWNAELRWLAEHTVPMSQGEGMRRWRSHVGSSATAMFADGSTLAFFRRCLHFDSETRQCTDYDNRPPMCRNYPWHGATPRPNAALPKTCGYWLDVGVTPVAIETRHG